MNQFTDRLIANMTDCGHVPLTIAEQLNESGIRKPDSDAEWTEKAVRSRITALYGWAALEPAGESR